MIIAPRRHSLPHQLAAPKTAPANDTEVTDSVSLSHTPRELTPSLKAQAPSSETVSKIGLALLAGVSVLGAVAAAPAQAAPQSLTVATQQSAEQGPEFLLKQVALPHAGDNATAAQTRLDLTTMLETVTREYGTYQERLTTLRQTGEKLDMYLNQLQPGQHKIGDETVSIRRGETWSTVRVQNGDVVSQSIRNGKSRLVEIAAKDSTTTLMESEAAVTVEHIDGAALGIPDGMVQNRQTHHFDKKDRSFSVEDSSAWGQRKLTMRGRVMESSQSYRVHGFGGDLEITHSDRIEKPEVSITIYPGPVLYRESTRSVWNAESGEKTDEYSHTTLRQDGSTVLLRTLNGKTEKIEQPPATQIETPRTPLFFP